MTLRRVQWSDVTPTPKRARSLSSVPHSIGGGTPAGGGTYSAVMRKPCPVKPSSGQLASPTFPPRAADTQQLAGRLRLIGRKHHAKRGQYHIERPVRGGQVFGI